MGILVLIGFFFGGLLATHLFTPLFSEEDGHFALLIGYSLTGLAALLFWREHERGEDDRRRRAFLRREANDRRKLSSSTWRKSREAALRRDGFRCVKCGYGAEDVDHIVPRAMGGDVYDLRNLQSLCKPCHKAKTAREARMIRRHLDGR